MKPARDAWTRTWGAWREASGGWAGPTSDRGRRMNSAPEIDEPGFFKKTLAVGSRSAGLDDPRTKKDLENRQKSYTLSQ
jgi:hypothetical protein